MSTIQTATEALILLTKQAIHQNTVLVYTDDLFEVVWFKNSSVSKELKIHHDFGKNHDEFRLGLKKTHRRGVVDLE